MAAATGNARTLALLWAQCTGADAARTCDVRLTSEHFAHSFVLGAASPVMAAAMASQAAPDAVRRASPRVLRAALALMYGVVELDKLEAAELLELAALCRALAVADALPAVDRALAGAIDAHTALAVSKALPRDGALPLSAARVARVLRTDIARVASTPAWTAFRADEVAAALRVHDIAPNGEEAVFRAVELWVAAAGEGEEARAARIDAALPLLNWVRFPTMSDRALLRVARSPYFYGRDLFYQLLLEAFIRRADVRLVQAARRADERWQRVGVTDTSIGYLASDTEANERHRRVVLFEGIFPLRWYRNMRFRTRSARCMLFTFSVARWSTRQRRVRSESRTFADRRWSIWVDPHAAAATDNAAPSEKDYISLYLCCEADTPGLEGNEGSTTSVSPTRADYSLFLAHAEDGYGMERKVCSGRSFTFSGQAMGFRRHTRRERAVTAGYVDEARDELIVGAQIVIPGAEDTGVMRPDCEGPHVPSAATAGDSSPESWLPGPHDILRDLPHTAKLHPAYSARSAEPLLRGASAVSDAAAAEVVRNLNNSTSP